MSKKIKDGYHKDYHKNGEILREGNILNSKKSGTWKFYDNYGVLEKEENYLKGKKDGYFVHFQKNRKIKDGVHKDNKIYECNKYIYKKSSTGYFQIGVERYREGKKHGEWEITFDKEGYVPRTETINYRKGKKHGEHIIRNIKGENNYINWNESFLTVYQNGKKDGSYIRRNSNNKILESGEYKDGKKHGEWILFSGGGKVQQRLFYKNGKKNGNCYFYKSFSDFSNDMTLPTPLFSDIGKYLDEIGVSIQHYTEGNRTHRIVDINFTIDFKDDKIHGLFIMNVTKQDNKKGKLYEIDFKNGKKHGFFMGFNLYNFTKTSQIQFKNGKIHGKCYYFNNEYIKKQTYKNDVIHGPYEESDKGPSGPRFIVKKGQYKNGKKEGIWKYYRDKVIELGETWEKGKLVDSKEY